MNQPINRKRSKSVKALPEVLRGANLTSSIAVLKNDVVTNGAAATGQ